MTNHLAKSGRFLKRSAYKLQYVSFINALTDDRQHIKLWVPVIQLLQLVPLCSVMCQFY